MSVSTQDVTKAKDGLVKVVHLVEKSGHTWAHSAAPLALVGSCSYDSDCDFGIVARTGIGHCDGERRSDATAILDRAYSLVRASEAGFFGID